MDSWWPFAFCFRRLMIGVIHQHGCRGEFLGIRPEQVVLGRMTGLVDDFTTRLWTDHGIVDGQQLARVQR